jgi:hypothetical protein
MCVCILLTHRLIDINEWSNPPGKSTGVGGKPASRESPPFFFPPSQPSLVKSLLLREPATSRPEPRRESNAARHICDTTNSS